MRVSAQVAIIALVSGLSYGGYHYWPQIKPMLPASLAGAAPGPASAAVPTSGGGAPAAAQSGPPRQGGPGGAPQVVEVAPATRGRIVEIAESVGTTRALESVTLTTRVTGLIEAISFEEGQIVERGYELLRFDTAERRADLEAAKAAVITAQAQRAELQARLERARALRATGAGTDAQVVDLSAQARTADSTVLAAEARERSAAARLAEMVVRAPFTGRVGIRAVSLGALVEPRTVITTLDDLTKVRLDFSVPEVLISMLEVGRPIVAKSIAYGERAFAGTVAVIDTRVDTVTRSVKLTALIDNPDRALRPGMFMNVSLEVASRNDAITVPEEAVVGEGPRQIIFVVKDGRIDRRQVKIGQRQNARIEIVEGVAAGDLVVARGTQRARHGMPVVTRPIEGSRAQGPQAARATPSATN
ncbi:MAG: efflux RND transporter periplasmic adaptor subunit [Alphaproteobacteria bacterium]